METKTCSKCFELKDIKLFRVNRNQCKSCCSKDAMSNYSKRASSNPDIHKKQLMYLKEYRKINGDKRDKDKRRKYLKGYFLNKSKDPEYKILKNLRCRLYQCISDKYRASSKELTGLSTKELKKYLESKFLPGMSWDNYGLNGWHIDHIRPCVSYDLTDIEQQKACFNYKNLQPLWAKDNRIKSGKWLQ